MNEALTSILANSPSTGLVTCIKDVTPLRTLVGAGFQAWKLQVKQILMTENLWTYVNSEVKNPIPSRIIVNGPIDPLLLIRTKKLQATGLILLALDTNLRPFFDKPEYEEPVWLWTTLKTMNKQMTGAGFPQAWQPLSQSSAPPRTFGPQGITPQASLGGYFHALSYQVFEDNDPTPSFQYVGGRVQISSHQAFGVTVQPPLSLPQGVPLASRGSNVQSSSNQTFGGNVLSLPVIRVTPDPKETQIAAKEEVEDSWVNHKGQSHSNKVSLQAADNQLPVNEGSSCDTGNVRSPPKEDTKPDNTSRLESGSKTENLTSRKVTVEDVEDEGSYGFGTAILVNSSTEIHHKSPETAAAAVESCSPSKGSPSQPAAASGELETGGVLLPESLQDKGQSSSSQAAASAWPSASPSKGASDGKNDCGFPSPEAQPKSPETAAAAPGSPSKTASDGENDYGFPSAPQAVSDGENDYGFPSAPQAVSDGENDYGFPSSPQAAAPELQRGSSQPQSPPGDTDGFGETSSSQEAAQASSSGENAGGSWWQVCVRG
jgi:hypothetical protein